MATTVGYQPDGTIIGLSCPANNLETLNDHTLKTVLITGGTGLVGASLTRLLLKRGFLVIILTRDPERAMDSSVFGTQVSYAAWDVNAQTIDVEAVQKADFIAHLAGAGVVDKRWTEAYKKEIIDSRVNSTKLLLNTLSNNPHHVTAFVSSSAIGWYGPDTEQSLKTGFTEDAPADSHFLGETCRLWEESSLPLEQMGIRRVCLRTGIVLSAKGGAFVEFKKPLKFGVAAILGNGEQVVSWISNYDLCLMFEYAFENEQMQGVYNAVAPNPVTNKKLTLTIAKAIKDHWFIAIKVPSFVLKIMMGESSVEVLKSATVSSKKIEMAGFHFRLPTIEEAIEKLVK